MSKNKTKKKTVGTPKPTDYTEARGTVTIRSNFREQMAKFKKRQNEILQKFNKKP
jgi:hypothetical protein